VDVEKAAYRFAGAFLVPEDAARSELGQNRHTLDFFELHLLKHKYGLSMQGWVYRAKDLRIISEAAAKRLFMHFRKMGWHRREPGDQLDPEKPERMKRLLMRALAEDMISRTRASELLGMPLHQFWMKEAEKHDGFPTGPRSGH
jgi:Zn-dependent peptidase ImmA (M78 family)